MNNNTNFYRTESKDKSNNEKLADVCTFITDNYNKLVTELEEILKLLDEACTYESAYCNISKVMPLLHLKNSINKCDGEVLSQLLKLLETITKDSKKEFSQNVDLINMYSVVINELKKVNVRSLSSKSKKAINYIIYELGRIKSQDDINKKIIILKGMIMYE